jgi:hypothetical protein
MPKTKPRRKTDGKAVPHPGRGKEGSLLKLREEEERQEARRRPMQDSLRGLPLFDALKPPVAPRGHLAGPHCPMAGSSDQ